MRSFQSSGGECWTERGSGSVSQSVSAPGGQPGYLGLIRRHCESVSGGGGANGGRRRSESSCSGGNVRTWIRGPARSTILMFRGSEGIPECSSGKKRVPLKGKSLPDIPSAGLTDGFLVSEFSELPSWPPWLPVARHMTGGRGHISARHTHQLAVLTPFLLTIPRHSFQNANMERRESFGASGVDLRGGCSQLSRLIPGQQTRVGRARRSAGLVSLTADRVYSRRRWTDIRGGGEPEEPEQDAPRPRQPGFTPVTRTSLNSVFTHHSQIGPLR